MDNNAYYLLKVRCVIRRWDAWTRTLTGALEKSPSVLCTLDGSTPTNLALREGLDLITSSK